MTKKTKRKRWRETFGPHGSTVVIEERRPGGRLYLGRYLDGLFRSRSLGHRDRARARREAQELLMRLMRGEPDEVIPTFDTIVDLYQREALPNQSPHVQAQSLMHLEAWRRHLGASFDLREFGVSQWESFKRRRRTGTIDARGREVRRDKRKPVGEKVVASACETLRHGLRLATCERVGPNRFLLASDPSRGLSVPANPDPKRPLWSYDEYRALCAVADKVHPYMLTLLVLHYEAGRRLGANCGLRWSDWLPDDGPYGKLRWRGETDKQDRTTETPISMELRDAIEAHRRRFPGVGDAAVFPDSVRPGQVLRTHWPKNWILRCERLAEIEHVEHRGWHGFRRNFASELRHHSDVDVMELGGWRDLRTLKRCYQAADTDGMIAALEDRRRLRRAQ